MHDPLTTPSLPERPSWNALVSHAAEIKPRHLRELFDADAERGSRLVVQAEGLYFDYSKNRLTDETLGLLAQLARESHVEEHRDAMFAGEHINVSEDRAVLHIALRLPRDATLVVDGVDVVNEVHQVLDRMAGFSNRIRSGEWRGHTDKAIRNVVNIGIGGSDLGPVMAYEALRHYSQREMTFRFVSNVDATDFVEAVRDLDAEETLFIISSKTFGTLETLTNATSARSWLVERLGRRVGRREALRGGLHQRRESRGLWHRCRQYVRVLGLGRRPLLHGERDRALHHDRHWPRQLL